ncbi:MAG: S9 family peptidase, partial [Acidobacteria bacterium]|nr:S9 family peptidase [Acidobacteriota bacterium]
MRGCPASSARKWFFPFVVPLLAVLTATAQDTYRRPPKEVLDVLDAPATSLAVVSPARDRMILAEPVRYPSIADLAAPMLRIAGLRIDPATSGLHHPAHFINLVLKTIPDGKEMKIAAPAGAYLSLPVWSADGKQFALTNKTASSIELWIGNASTGAIRKVSGVALNSVEGAAFDWMPDGKTLLCKIVPANRGKAPERSPVPVGPTIQESVGRPGEIRTYEDMLQDSHDEALYDYYATVQLSLVDAASGKISAIGKPVVVDSFDPSPDGKFILVETIKRPYSHLVPSGLFPHEVEVWDLTGKLVHKVASVPLRDNLPTDGVQTGPRNVRWHPVEVATLVWAEALDGGDPKNKVPHHDRVVALKAPFTSQPTEIGKTEHRFIGVTFGESGNFAILRELDRTRNRSRAWFLNPNDPSAAPKVVWDQSIRERYQNPGTPVNHRLANGHNAILQSGNFIYLSGLGATPQGDRPFLDKLDIATLKSERLFRGDEKSYESLTALLAPDGSKFMTRHESPSEPPNFFIRTQGSDAKQAFTHFTDPTPQLRLIKKELVKYKRADGVDLSFTMYLPPDYKQGERRPAVVWAYPLEFTDAATAGQVSASPNRFTSISGISHLFLTLAGYVVLDDATIPVIGDPETMNNTYVEQVVSSAKAAIDKAAELGVIDPNRVGVGGHSYGAFMTANLLAHSDLFRAGVARSGAYNRTLTPFGFQSERRTIWQARDMYMKVSPFLFADKIKVPILLIHGEADSNSGTFPIQSERMYQAIKGNGGTVRYVTLPFEAHGYAARESTEHTLWEM